MRWGDVIQLITTQHIEENNGSFSEIPVFKKIFANKKSIRQSEFYQAQQQDLKLELMFVVRSAEYNGEQQLKYEEKTYNIIRTYDKNGETIELICSVVN